MGVFVLDVCLGEGAFVGVCVLDVCLGEGAFVGVCVLDVCLGMSAVSCTYAFDQASCLVSAAS